MKKLAFLLYLAALPRLAAAADTTPPRFEHEPCEAYQQGQPFMIVVRIYDESAIFDPKVHYRTEGDERWKSAPLAKQQQTNDFAAAIPVADLGGPLLYFVEAFDENGNGPAQFGALEAPVRVVPSARAPACVQVGGTEGALGLSTSSTLTGGGLVLKEEQYDCDSGEHAPWHCSGAARAGILGAVLLVGASAGALYWFVLRPDEPPVRRPDKVSLRVTGVDPTARLPLSWSLP